MNFAFTVNIGCELILTTDYCYQRFWDMWHYCDVTTYYGDKWSAGGMLNDTCGQFYMTAGAELTGYLWYLPLSDMVDAASW
jgi:hypothetical protein